MAWLSPHENTSPLPFPDAVQNVLPCGLAACSGTRATGNTKCFAYPKSLRWWQLVEKPHDETEFLFFHWKMPYLSKKNVTTYQGHVVAQTVVCQGERQHCSPCWPAPCHGDIWIQSKRGLTQSQVLLTHGVRPPPVLPLFNLSQDKAYFFMFFYFLIFIYSYSPAA